MHKSKKKIIVIGAVAIALVVSMFVNITIGVSAGVSLLEAVLHSWDEDPQIPELKDFDVEEMSETIAAGDLSEDDYFDELHKMILLTDLTKISDDDAKSTFIDSNSADQVGISGLKLKDYLLIYKLAAEICNRSEINPSNADVIIKPTYLIGECLAEGFIEYEQGNIDGIGACAWINKSRFSQIMSGTGASIEPTRGKKCEDIFGVYPSFIGQDAFYCYEWGLSADYDLHDAIYISTQENPDLDNSKRAIFAEREELYTNGGMYMSEEFWTDRTKLSKASTSDIKNSIKTGIFEPGSKEIGYKTRPASYLLSDCMYTHALQIRAMLLGRSIDHMTYTNHNCQLSVLVDDIGQDLVTRNKDIYNDIAVMCILTRFIGEYISKDFYMCDDKSEDPGYLGSIAKTYGQFVRKNTSPLIKPSNRTERESLVGYPSSSCTEYIYGNKKFVCLKNVELPNWQLAGTSNHSFYGFDCLNMGNLTLPAFEAQIKGAYSKYKLAVPEESSKDDAALNGLLWPFDSKNLNILDKGAFINYSDRKHVGIDIGANEGDTPLAVADATLVASTDSHQLLFDLGKVSYKFEDKDYDWHVYAVYGNVSAKSGLKVGSTIKQGEVIGKVLAASTENGCQPAISGTNSHMHLGLIIQRAGATAAGTGNSAWVIPITTNDENGNSIALPSYINPRRIPWHNKQGTIVTSKLSQSDRETEEVMALYGSEDTIQHKADDCKAIIESLFSSFSSGGFIWPTNLVKIEDVFGPPGRDKYLGNYNNISGVDTSQGHSGVDIPVGWKTNVLAIADGEVVYAQYCGNLGNYMVIRHKGANYDFCSGYAHLEEFEVEVGSKVTKGQVVALSGSTGTTNYHLHFELIKGKSFDDRHYSTLIDPMCLDYDNISYNDFSSYFEEWFTGKYEPSYTWIDSNGNTSNQKVNFAELKKEGKTYTKFQEIVDIPKLKK